ncbi:Calcineurin-like phosphoesterase [Caballeronia terrestris]|uniref:Calcineurin-like phosphoesterase n=1 Tax=Caballeronia terrestris TaxID=1226301 RepID=A0A158KE42_9BURK|nr:metallophosphoesterase [Caballeronia terrestris]SAL79396.1 Calcineurin-like phosphoesterase [Caballeronia terrestris]
MPLLIHSADWQIGAAFGQFDPEDALFLAAARIESVKTLARVATSKKADLVVVTGDVFDQQTIPDALIRKLFNAMDGFSGKWVLLPGNHDAALVESVWTRAMRLNCLPENVTVVLKPGTILLDDLKIALLCAPLTQRKTYVDTTEFFDTEVTPDGYLRVGLAHGSVKGYLPDDIDSTNPISAQRAETARLDYLALGDWHGALSINTRTWYAGTHEQDRFKTNEPGFALAVELTESGAEPAVSRERVGQYSWHRWERTVSVSSDAGELASDLAALGEADVLRLTVTGSADMTATHVIEDVIAQCRAKVRALRYDTSALGLLPSDEELANLGAQGGYIATVVARLKEMQEDTTQGPAASEALKLLAQAQRDTKEPA